MNMSHLSNYSYDELAEALTNEIEQAYETFREVSRIKDILHNWGEESDPVLYESLRKLQLMALNVETLKATEIGKAVNGLRKHGSKQIRHLARTLIDGWKDMVDEWVNATAAITGTDTMSDSVNLMKKGYHLLLWLKFSLLLNPHQWNCHRFHSSSPLIVLFPRKNHHFNEMAIN